MRFLWLAAAMLCYASQPLAQRLSAEPIAQPICAAPKNPALRQIADAMCNGKLLAAFASVVNQTFKLPKPLPIVGIECGQSNAFYDRGKVAIFVCYELGKEIFDRAAREIRATGDAQSQIAAGALFFAFVHELGHAIINLYDLPVLGREEDAADQIGSLLLIVLAGHKPEVAQYWTVGAHWFFNKRPLFFARGHFADEHSVNPQRQFNIACWIYGSDPNRYVQFAQYAKLPNSRAQRCPGEYQQMVNAAKQMLRDSNFLPVLAAQSERQRPAPGCGVVHWCHNRSWSVVPGALRGSLQGRYGKYCAPLARFRKFGKSGDSERCLGRCSGDVGDGVVGERQARRTARR